MPFGPWRPDQPEYLNDGTPYVRNVLMASSKSYGPFPQLGNFTNSGLTERSQGGAGFVSTSGVVNLFTGDRQNLYALIGASATFSNVSSALNAYSVDPKDMWKFEFFKNQVIATQIGNAPQAFTVGVSSAFANLSAGAPKAKYVAAIKDQFLMLAYTSDGTYGVQPQRYWWSAVGDATNWPTPGSTAAITVQSSFNDILNGQGVITGLVGGLAGADGVIFQEHSVRKIMYSGAPAFFETIPCANVRGCLAPGSIVQVGTMVFYYGEDGFYSFDGTTATPIGGDKVDQFFLKDCQFANLHRMVGAADPLSKNVFWAYPNTYADDGTPNRILVYNWLYGEWTLIEESVEMLTRFVGIGFTLDQLWTVLGFKIDEVPFPFDSNVWIGGRYNIGFFGPDHKLGYTVGSPMEAILRTKQFSLFPGRRTLSRKVRPLVDGGTPTVSMGSTDVLGTALTWGPTQAINSLGFVPGRKSGRYLQAELRIPAGTAWSHCMGLEIDAAEVKGTR